MNLLSNYANQAREYANQAHTFMNLDSTKKMLGVINELQNSSYNHPEILSRNKKTIMDFMVSIGFDTRQLISLLNMYRTNKETIDEIITFINQNTPQNTKQNTPSYSGLTPSIPTYSPPPVSTLTPEQKEQKKQQLIDIMRKYDESKMTTTKYTQQQKNEFINAKREYTKLFGTEPYSYTTTPTTSSSWGWPFGGGKRRTRRRRTRKQHKKLKTKRSKTQRRYHHR